MATVAPNGQDPNEQGSGPNMGGSGTITGSSGAPGITGGNASAYQSPAAPRGNPGGMPNVQDYFNANQGAGARLNNSITGNVQNQANQVNQNYNTSQSQLNNLYNPLNQNISQGQSAANTAFQNPQDLLTAYQTAQAQANPAPGTTPTAPNQQNLSAYNAFEGDIAGTQQYNQNQQQLQNYNQAGQQAVNNLQPQVGNLQQTANMGANQMGQNQLLQRAVGTPNYNMGQQTLDSLFLSGQGNKLQQNLNNIYNKTNQNVQGLNTDYQSKLSALNQLAGQNTAYAQNLFLNGPGTGAAQGQGLNQIASNVQNQYNNLSGPNGSAAQAQAALQSAAATNGFTPEQLQSLGLTSGQHTWGVTPTDLLTAGGYSPTALAAYNQGGAAQAATADQLARYNALNQLAGGPAGVAQPGIFGTSTTAGYSPYTLSNPSEIQNAIDARQQTVTGTDFQNALNGLVQNLPNTGGPRPGFGGFSPAQSSNPNYNNFLSQLNQGIVNKSLNPDALNSLVQNYMANPGPNQDQNVLNQIFNPFTQYYKNEYAPASTSIINGQGIIPMPDESGAHISQGNKHLGTTVIP